MGPKCNMPKCDIRAEYVFFLDGFEGLDDIETFRCIYHMALNISKVELTNSELMTIQKVTRS